MRENENRRNLHQRGKPYAGPHVVAEIKERRTERPDPGNYHPVYTRSHHMLANAEMEVAPRVAASLEVARSFKLQRSFVRSSQVGRAADQPGNILRQHVQHLP